MVSNPEVFIDASTNIPMKSPPVKKPSAQKSVCLFTNEFDVKKKKQNVVLGLQNQNSEP